MMRGLYSVVPKGHQGWCCSYHPPCDPKSAAPLAVAALAADSAIQAGKGEGQREGRVPDSRMPS